MFSLIRRSITFTISILLLGFAVAMAFDSQDVRAFLFPLPPATLLRYSFDTPNDTPFKSHSNPDADYEARDGHFSITTRRAGRAAIQLLNATDKTILSIRADTDPPDTSPDSEIGLIFLYKDTQNYYWLSWDQAGFFTVRRFFNGTERLITRQQSQALHIGETNQLKVDVQESMIAFHINGKKVFELYNGEQQLGTVGLGVQGAFARAETLSFDNLEILQRASVR
jgi:hypothetical protein